jgi:RNA polymerase sigma factor (sigma-70 family)
MSQTPELPERAGRAVRELTEMPPAFWAFHEQYYPAYYDYARLQLGDERAAEDLVHRFMLDLAVTWSRLMTDAAPEATAWAILRLSVTKKLAEWGRQPALSETAAFRHATRRVLDSFRPNFAVLESRLGLYAAIARLPERHYDVIVLQYVLGYPPRRVASIMGIEQPTVRAHRRNARARLARELGLEVATDHDDDEDE